MKKQEKSEGKVKLGREQASGRREEERRLKRMRVMVDLVTGVLYQDQGLTLLEARRLVESTERAVLRLFPDKQFTYDLILRPRFERILLERWGEGLERRVH